MHWWSKNEIETKLQYDKKEPIPIFPLWAAGVDALEDFSDLFVEATASMRFDGHLILTRFGVTG